MTSDNEIIGLYMQRDERAITETAEKYGAYCNKIAYNILNDRFESEECVNDTYLRTWNSIPPTMPQILSAFLAKITRNLALDRYKTRKAQKRDGPEISLDELSECLGGRDISDEIEISALGEAISRFLLTENEICRRIFVHRYFYQESIAGIAKFFRISESKVKTSLHRTRLRLAKFLGEEGFYI